jgi:glycosyltransferase 2 family protein
MGFSYWAFKDVSVTEIVGTFKGASVPYVLLCFVFMFSSNVVRGLRWNLMLEPLGYKAGTWSISAAVMIGYATNLFVPRAGEISRAVSLQKMEGIPTDKSFGAVIAERIIDVLTLLLLLVLNLIVEKDRILALLFKMSNGKLNTSSVLLVLGVAVFFCAALWLFREGLKSIVQSNTLLTKVYNLVSGFKDGFLSVFKLEKVSLFFLYTVLLWFLYFLVCYYLMKALPIGAGVTWKIALSILVVGSVGMAVPSLGGLGSFHLLVTAILMQYAYSEKEGLAIATFQHTANGIIFVLIQGLGSLIYSLFKSKK